MNETTIYGITHTGPIKDDIISAGTIAPIWGVKFPLFDKDNSAKGIFIKTKGFELLKSMVRQFIKTERGERVMLPNFGLSLNRFLFEPITPDLIMNIKNEIISGFAQYLPQVSILGLNVGEGKGVQSNGLSTIQITMVITSFNSNQQAEISLSL